MCNPNKTPKYHKFIHCKKVFQHLSKLNQRLKIHADKNDKNDTCGKVYQFEKHLVQHKITYTDAYPSMLGETTSTCINDENNSSNFYDVHSPNETLILQSEVNPEEQVDSADVLTEPVSFSSVLHTPPHKKQLKKAKVVQKKVFDINSLLDRVQEQEKLRIIQRLANDNSTHMNTLYESFIKYYKDLVRNARRSHLSKVEATKALQTVFGDELHDVDFQEWLIQEGLCNSERLVNLLKYAEDETEQRGRL